MLLAERHAASTLQLPHSVDVPAAGADLLFPIVFPKRISAPLLLLHLTAHLEADLLHPHPPSLLDR